MDVSVTRNNILENLDNKEVWGQIEELTKYFFGNLESGSSDGKIGGLGKYLKKGKIEGEVVKYGSTEIGGGFAPDEFFRGLSYDQKRALTSAPVHTESFRLKKWVQTEVLGEEIMKLSVSDPEYSQLAVQKVANLSVGLAKRLWDEFLGKMCQYDETDGNVKYPVGDYFFGQEDSSNKLSKAVLARNKKTVIQYKTDVAKFEASLTDSTWDPTLDGGMGGFLFTGSTYNESQILKFDLLHKDVTQNQIASKMTELIACISESKVVSIEGGTGVAKRNTRAGNKAYCRISDILLFVDWKVFPQIKITLQSPMVDYKLVGMVADIIPCTLIDNFQVVGMSKNCIKCSFAIEAIEKEKAADTLKTTIYKHSMYHIDLSARNPLCAIRKS